MTAQEKALIAVGEAFGVLAIRYQDLKSMQTKLSASEYVTQLATLDGLREDLKGIKKLIEAGDLSAYESKLAGVNAVLTQVKAFLEGRK